MENHYDIAIIGAGPGGYVAAIHAAQLGLKTVCIDKRKELGGTCLNVGCIPSKALLSSTELFHRFQHDRQEHGISASDISIDFSSIMKRKNEIINHLENGIQASFKNSKVNFKQGQARFLTPHSLLIENRDKTETIEAKYILIATGSEPIKLPNLEFDEHQILSSTGALSLSKVPQRMVVIGGGSIGLELASVYNRLGTQVTVIEMLNRICFSMDQSISENLLLSLKKQGIQFMLSTQVITSVVQPNEVIFTVANEQKLENLSADVALVAVGRRPFTDGLDLDQIGVLRDKKGFITVDKAFRTSINHIFAYGDVVQGAMLAHRASEEGVAIVEMIAGKKVTLINSVTIPNVIYTSPEAASVGLTEEEAKQAQLSINIGKSQFKANPRAKCNGETEGFVKIISEARTNRLIGLHILGAHASELIAQGMIAINKKATLQDLAYAPYAHPTLSETIKEAAFLG